VGGAGLLLVVEPEVVAAHTEPRPRPPSPTAGGASGEAAPVDTGREASASPAWPSPHRSPRLPAATALVEVEPAALEPAVDDAGPYVDLPAPVPQPPASAASGDSSSLASLADSEGADPRASTRPSTTAGLDARVVTKPPPAPVDRGSAQGGAQGSGPVVAVPVPVGTVRTVAWASLRKEGTGPSGAFGTIEFLTDGATEYAAKLTRCVGESRRGGQCV
jgi:hypothetical protein